MTQLAELERALGYQFADQGLLKLALTHRSFGARNNERLEFLGDSLLNYAIADALFKQFPEAREGQLSRLRAQLVRGETLAQIARELGVSVYLTLSDGERKTGGADRDSILADSVEALFGAIYSDAGLDCVLSVIGRLYQSRLAALSLAETPKDSKSRLQELMQGRQLPLPEYQVIDVQGQGHEQVFTVACRVAGLREPVVASATNRKKAEKITAEQALTLLSRGTAND